MAGCKGCSSCAPNTNLTVHGEAQKLEKCTLSENERYPHLLCGSQAILYEKDAQTIVTVLEDCCDDCQDRFRVKKQAGLKGRTELKIGDEFEICQPAGQKTWKLHALI